MAPIDKISVKIYIEICDYISTVYVQNCLNLVCLLHIAPVRCSLTLNFLLVQWAQISNGLL